MYDRGDVIGDEVTKKNKALGQWVAKQRDAYKKYQKGDAKSTMNPDKIRRLEGIGFVWSRSYHDRTIWGE